MSDYCSPERIETALRRVLTFKGLHDPRWAVVIPVVCGGNAPEVLLEVRAEGISQSGDPCYPGGRIEAGESPLQAALREVEEELGLRIDPARVCGQLPTVGTPLGSRTDIFVCTVAPADADSICANPAEVEEVLRLPLEKFLSEPRAGSWSAGRHVIWGMTAGALRHLCEAWRAAGL